MYDINGIPKTIIKTTTASEIDVAGLTPYTQYQFFVKRKTDPGFPVIETLKARTLEAGNVLKLFLFHMDIHEKEKFYVPLTS